MTRLSNIIKLSVFVNGEMFLAAPASCISGRALAGWPQGTGLRRQKAIHPTQGSALGKQQFPTPSKNDLIDRMVLFFSYSGDRSDTFCLGFFLGKWGEMNPPRELRGLQRDSTVGVFTGVRRSWYRLPALLHCLFWAGSGNSLQFFPCFAMPTW